MSEFVATHRSNGTDNLACFDDGELLMFVRASTEADGWSKSFASRNGEFVNKAGIYQTVFYTGVEAI